MEVFAYDYHGRTPKRVIALVLAVTLILLAVAILDMSWLVAGIMGLFVLPLAYEVMANPMTRTRLDGDTLTWSNGRDQTKIPLAEIDTVRFDTRLDFSVRTTILTKDGRKTRFPPDTLPPPARFAKALEARGVPVARHHFTLRS